MLCFVLEDMTALRIFNVEDEAAFATTVHTPKVSAPVFVLLQVFFGESL
jgi:hypothetical protein